VSKGEAIEAALRLLNEGYARGLIPEEAYVREDARLRARQAEIRAWRDGQGRGAPPLKLPTGLPGGLFRSPGPQASPAAGSPPAGRPGAAQGHLAFPRRPIRLDLPIRLLRRRGLAYGGMLPPVIAKAFTVGQAAVLTVIAWEVLHHSACRKSYAEIADEAGCSREWVKATIRLARIAGLLTVEHRPRPGRFKDETNVVRVLSADWLAWIRTRRERIEKGQRAAASGESRVSSPPNGSRNRRGFATREQPWPALESPSKGCREARGGEGG
jgi:hypothetical protein